MKVNVSRILISGTASAELLVSPEPLSFWGGVDPETGRVIDVHHPLLDASLSGKILMLPTSRGSCSGSGVLLQLALNDRAPAAILLRDVEEILTLGGLVASHLFARNVPIAVLTPQDYDALSGCRFAHLTPDGIDADTLQIPLAPFDVTTVELSDADQADLDGENGEAPRLAMTILRHMACLQGAKKLIDVTRAHIDGTILAHDANLLFAERMEGHGACVRIPATINAISVDRENWQAHSVPPDFGLKASRLSDAYVRMGCRPTFTCAPYTLDDVPTEGERIGWSESNAVIFANSVLGARTAKHPDYLDLFIALTGRAPCTGVYLKENRRPAVVITVEAPRSADDCLWPLVGWSLGNLCPDKIPLVRGLEATVATRADLKSLCAAFGTTSSAPMLHVSGHTPEATMMPTNGAENMTITGQTLAETWSRLNTGPCEIDLVALGSPHFSFEEAAAFAEALGDRKCSPNVSTLMTVGRHTANRMEESGLTEQLKKAGVRILQDLCWCSMTEPVFPPETAVIMTNSAKYAHYAPGLSGRPARFGSLLDCADAAATGRAPGLPEWLS